MTSTRDWTLPDRFGPAPLPSEHALPSWWTLNSHTPYADLNQSTELPRDCRDVTVIGSGISGICTAFHLVSLLPRGSSIVVLEARQFCSGATGRNGGHLATQTKYFFGDIADKTGSEDAIAADRLETRSEDWLLRMARGHPGWARDVLLNDGGDVIFFDSDGEMDEFKAGVKRATELGLDTSKFKYYSAQECERKWNVKAPVGACWHPAANFFPLRFVSRLYELALQKANENGVKLDLYTHAPVTSVRRSPKSSSKWSIEVDSKRRGSSTSSFETRAVVHATNGYASHLLPSYSRGAQRIVPTRGQVSSFYEPRDKQHHEPWQVGLAAGGDGNYYMFETLPLSDNDDQDRRVILGGGRLFADPGLEWGVTDDTVNHPDVSKGTLKWLERFAPGREWEREIEWTGIMGFTPTHSPFVGPAYEGDVKLEGQFISAGFNGHGMPRTPACAEAIASMTAAYLTGQEWTKPDWLPSYFLTKPHDQVHEEQDTLVGSIMEKGGEEADTSKGCCLIK